jgi:drug/metabolite transporter (DMT)-like permease
VTRPAGPATVPNVLTSLHQAVTALAARSPLSERLRAVQATGAGLALVGTLLLATD